MRRRGDACAVLGRVTLVGLAAGRIPWPVVSVPERSGSVVTCAVRGRVTLVGLSAGRSLSSATAPR